MQCVTCNKSSLFAPRLKTLENMETTNIIMEQYIFKNVVEMKDTNSFLYKIEIHSMYLNKYKFNSNSTIVSKLNSNSIKDNWYANWWKMYSIYSFEYVVGKNIQYTNMKRHLSMALHLGMS
jgi:hypothetical protein